MPEVTPLIMTDRVGKHSSDNMGRGQQRLGSLARTERRHNRVDLAFRGVND